MNHRLTFTAALATVLASVAIYSLIDGGAWFWAGAGAATVAGLVGTLTRRRVLPFLICALASVAGLLLYLTVLFAGHEAIGRVVPTLSSLQHLWWLAGQGMTESARYSPPVPAQHGILLLTVAGIGITAVAADLLAVRLRRPAAAGLPLLVLFCVPLTTAGHRSSFGAASVFCLGMAGYLALLAADGRERLRVWGRLVTLWQPPSQEAAAQRSGPNTSELAASGRRVGLAAVVLALCVPLLLPGMRPHRLFSGSGGTGTGSGGFAALPNPLAQMNSDLHRSTPLNVLTMRTTTADPQYLQVYVLDKLSTTTWTLTPSPGAPLRGTTLPAAPGVARGEPTTTQRTNITLVTGLSGSQLTDNYLPLPYPARTVTIGGSWLADQGTLTMFSTSTSLSGLTYAVTSKEPSPTDAQLRRSPAPPAAIKRNDLTVPAAFNQLGTLARQITRGQASAYAKAIALQRWFTSQGRFTYSLNVGQPDSSAALINFLTKTRRGYCQQFAFAMAVLARLVGIPSRVAIGYTPGTYLGGGRWLVKTSDAHAWPELYFQGAGWLRFEPTPSGAAGQDTAFQPPYTLPILPAGPILPPSGTLPGGSGPTPGASASGAPGAGFREAPGGGTTAAGKRGGSSMPVGIVLAAILGLALVAPRAARSLTRRKRWLQAADDAKRAHAAWLELLDDLADHAIACPASESPRALAARVVTTLGLAPAEKEALLRIARAEEQAHYARKPATSGTLRADVTLVRRAVSRISGRRTRWHARLMPASALAPARTALQNVLDVFGWMDRITLRRHARERGGRGRIGEADRAAADRVAMAGRWAENG
jgi:hypothetical protein